MHLSNQNLLLSCALVLTVGLVSCSKDRRPSEISGPTGMLVHEPVIIHPNGKVSTLSDNDLNRAVRINLHDKMKLAPVLKGGQDLATVRVQSKCSVLNQPLPVDSVTLPYRSEYTVVQFFTAQTILNKIWGGATHLNCSMHFNVKAINGSTHEFSLHNIQLYTEDPNQTHFKIYHSNQLLSDYDGYLSMDYSHLASYRVEIRGVNYRKAALVCEVNRAEIQRDDIDGPLNDLQFKSRADIDQHLATQKYASQQFCRIIAYRSDSAVTAVSDLILMTMTEPSFSVVRGPTGYPSLMSSHNIFDYTWRNYFVANQSNKILYFAVPPLADNTFKFENYLFASGNYNWAKVKIPSLVLIRGPSFTIDGAKTFAIGPHQKIELSIGAMPHDFICDQSRLPVMYTVQYDASEIPIYEIQTPTLNLAVDNILYTLRLEKQFKKTVTNRTFGDNRVYGNTCQRIKPDLWVGCVDNGGASPRPLPYSQAARNDNMCTRVD